MHWGHGNEWIGGQLEWIGDGQALIFVTTFVRKSHRKVKHDKQLAPLKINHYCWVRVWGFLVFLGGGNLLTLALSFAGRAVASVQRNDRRLGGDCYICKQG